MNVVAETIARKPESPSLEELAVLQKIEAAPVMQALRVAGDVIKNDFGNIKKDFEDLAYEYYVRYQLDLAEAWKDWSPILFEKNEKGKLRPKRNPDNGWKRKLPVLGGAMIVIAMACAFLNKAQNKSTPVSEDGGEVGGEGVEGGEIGGENNNCSWLLQAMIVVGKDVGDGGNFVVVGKEAIDKAEAGDVIPLSDQISCVASQSLVEGAENLSIDSDGDGVPDDFNNDGVSDSLNLLNFSRPEPGGRHSYLAISYESGAGEGDFALVSVFDAEGVSFQAEGNSLVTYLPEIFFEEGKAVEMGGALLRVDQLENGLNLVLSLGGQEDIVLTGDQIASMPGWSDLASEAAEVYAVLASERLDGRDPYSLELEVAGVEVNGNGGIPGRLSTELQAALSNEGFITITATVDDNGEVVTDVVNRYSPETGVCEVMLTRDIHPEGSDLNRAIDGVALYTPDGTRDDPTAAAEWQALFKFPVPDGVKCVAAIAKTGHPELAAGTTVVWFYKEGKGGFVKLLGKGQIVYEPGYEITVEDTGNGISWVVMDSDNVVVDEQSLSFGQQLTEEMQAMGLQLEEDEDGRTIAVDERGYMRFYENEAGVWVDWYQELIDGSTTSFWSSRGEFNTAPEIKQMDIWPVWTGDTEAFSLTMDGVEVGVQSLVCVITDPVDPSIIREVLVPVNYSLPDGQEAMSPLLWGLGGLRGIDAVLDKLKPGDQLNLEIFTRIEYRDSACTLTYKCGPPIMLIQQQGLNQIFTDVFEENDSSSWPERLIIPVFSIDLK